MPINFNTRNTAFNIPFWMFDLDNKQIFMTNPIPSDISDTKDIVLTEVPIPGKNSPPIVQGGGGVRKVSFQLPLIKRNNTVGNILLLKQIDQLRNQAPGLLKFFADDFAATPKVLFNWGIGSVPMIWYVKKADATHKQGWTNAFGQPQFSEISFELWLDEDNILYKAEEIWRKISALTGMVVNTFDTVSSQATGGNPY